MDDESKEKSNVIFIYMFIFVKSTFMLMVDEIRNVLHFGTVVVVVVGVVVLWLGVA